MKEYIYIRCYAAGNSESGFKVYYETDGYTFKTSRRASLHGFKELDSDDFLIGVIKDKKLLNVLDSDGEALKWEEEDYAEVRDNLDIY